MSLTSEDIDMGLIKSIGQGNELALEQLYERHGLRLLNYLIGQLRDRNLAEEVLQNVMLSVWKAAAGFRGDSKVTTWLIAIARNHAINARRRRIPPPLPLNESEADHQTGPMEALMRNAERAEIHTALRQLPEEQRETLELIFYHQLTGSEAAELLGVSVGTIKSRLHRAKTALRHLLLKGERNNG